MKLFGRRDASPVATYAAVLDGVHLWVDLDRLSLRDVESGAVVEVTATPVDLTGLTGTAYDVLVNGDRVLLAGLPDRGPGRPPLAPDGATRWDVALDGAHLRVLRTQVAPTAELAAIDLRADRVHLRIAPSGPVEPGTHLLLLDTDDTLLATVPVTAHDGQVEALVGVDDVPAGHFGMVRFALGTETTWVRVRRRGNALADPNHASLLPELYDEHGTTDHPRARFRWSPDGLLVLRALDPSAAAPETPAAPS
jgi:hypothetical protein